MSHNKTTCHEKDITTSLGIPYTTKLIFMYGKLYRNLEEVYRELEGVYQGLDLSFKAFKQSIKLERVFDEIIHPNNLKMLTSNPSRGNLSKLTEEDFLRAFDLTKSDIEVLRRIFNLNSTSEALSFVKHQRTALQSRR